MNRYHYCEFGHLMVPKPNPLFGGKFWAHVFEGDALSCAVYVSQGWPDARAEIGE